MESLSLLGWSKIVPLGRGFEISGSVIFAFDTFARIYVAGEILINFRTLGRHNTKTTVVVARVELSYVDFFSIGCSS